MKKLTHQQILLRQKEKMSLPFLPISVVLNNIRSLHNVGSIFRTADGIGVEKIWLCGITGCPPQSKIAKIALGAEQRIPWEYVQDARQVISFMKKKKYQIVLLEQTQKSIDYFDFKPAVPVCLVLGNEKEGVSDNLLDYCDISIEIGMRGIKNSLNVAVAFGVVGYHFQHFLQN